MFDELYQEILMDHYRHPRNAAPLDHLPESYVHENPVGGDSLKLEVVYRDGVVDRVSVDSHGCAISTASASLMSELLKGKTREDALKEVNNFLSIMRGELPAEGLEDMGDLVCLRGVTRMPLRVKCATLAWHAAAGQLERVSLKS